MWLDLVSSYFPFRLLANFCERARTGNSIITLPVCYDILEHDSFLSAAKMMWQYVLWRYSGNFSDICINEIGLGPEANTVVLSTLTIKQINCYTTLLSHNLVTKWHFQSKKKLKNYHKWSDSCWFSLKPISLQNATVMEFASVLSQSSLYINMSVQEEKCCLTIINYLSLFQSYLNKWSDDTTKSTKFILNMKEKQKMVDSLL